MRYFIIFYTFESDKSNGIQVCERLKYPNLKDFRESLSEYQEAMITNIIELPEADYKDFIK